MHLTHKKVTQELGYHLPAVQQCDQTDGKNQADDGRLRLRKRFTFGNLRAQAGGRRRDLVKCRAACLIHRRHDEKQRPHKEAYNKNFCSP